jgi:transposase
MEGTPLLPLPEGMLIDQIQVTKTGLVISVIATHSTSCCPLCSQPSESMHSHYPRSSLWRQNRAVDSHGSKILLP